MSEWELIECFRRMVKGQLLPYHELGSGYQTDVDLCNLRSQNGIYLHSYRRDSVIGRTWFQDRGITVPDPIWQRAQTWYQVKEVDLVA